MGDTQAGVRRTDAARPARLEIGIFGLALMLHQLQMVAADRAVCVVPVTWPSLGESWLSRLQHDPGSLGVLGSSHNFENGSTGTADGVLVVIFLRQGTTTRPPDTFEELP